MPIRLRLLAGVLLGALLLTADVAALAASLDHFQCYAVRRQSFRRAGVELVDAQGTSTVDVSQPRRICTPVDKNGEDPSAPTDLDHLIAYRIRQRTPAFAPVNQVVVNQFGTTTVTIRRPEMLLVPSRKDLGTTPPTPAVATLDHFKCYRVKGPRTPVSDVQLVDQFGTRKVNVIRPRRLCLAADKNGEGVSGPGSSLLCYEVRLAAGSRSFRPGATFFTNNQFGPDTLSTFRPRELCVPSNPTGPTPTPTPTEGATATPTPTEVSTAIETPTPTGTPDVTATATETPTPSPTATETETPTDTPTPTATDADTPTATPTPACGNGTTDPGEDCDDGNASDNDDCKNDCTFNVCGDGVLNPFDSSCLDDCLDSCFPGDIGCLIGCYIGCGGFGFGEECDDGNTTDCDGCSSICTTEPTPACGNGSLECGEQCDDSNTSDCDGCSATCQSEPTPVCGNNAVECGEACDDGNTNNFDGCAADCSGPGFD